MINIGTLYERILSLLNQHQTGKQFSPEQFNNDIQYIVNTYIKTKWGLPETGDTPEYFEVSQKVIDDLRFLGVDLDGIENPALQVSNKGIAQLPENYWHLVGGIFIDSKSTGCSSQRTEERAINFLPKDKFISSKSNSLLKGTYKNPVATIRGSNLVFEPKDLNFVNISYLRKIATPFFDYDIINDEAIFLPAGQTHTTNNPLPIGTPSRTVNLELPDDCIDDIAFYFIPEAGMRQREDGIYQMGQARKKSGN